MLCLECHKCANCLVHVYTVPTLYNMHKEALKKVTMPSELEKNGQIVCRATVAK